MRVQQRLKLTHESVQSDQILHCLHEETLLQNLPSEDSDQGPVAQSIVSLTSSLRVISLTVLADLIYIILIFFAEKM